jgi:hypothetical protein
MSPQPQPFDINPLIQMMLLSKQGKNNMGDMSSMVNFLDNPWLGILTGSYDPLTQQQQQDVPASETYDYIASDPNSPLALKRVAQMIVEENLPVHVVKNEIKNMKIDGGYNQDDLNEVANKLVSERADVAKAKNSSAKNNMFSKAGFSDYTEQYSDNPELAPFNPEARNYMSSLAQQASSLRGQADFDTKNIAGQNKKLAGQNLNAEQIQKLLKQNAKEMLRGPNANSRISKENLSRMLPFQTIGRIFDNPFNNDEPFFSKKGTLLDKSGRGANEQQVKDSMKKEKELKSQLAKAKAYEKKYGKGSKAPVNEVYGDLRDPKNLAKYFEIQSKIQTANQLERQAKEYGGSVISNAEQQGRTPFMDQLTQRMLATRLTTGK